MQSPSNFILILAIFAGLLATAGAGYAFLLYRSMRYPDAPVLSAHIAQFWQRVVRSIELVRGHPPSSVNDDIARAYTLLRSHTFTKLYLYISMALTAVAVVGVVLLLAILKAGVFSTGVASEVFLVAGAAVVFLGISAFERVRIRIARPLDRQVRAYLNLPLS